MPARPNQPNLGIATRTPFSPQKFEQPYVYSNPPNVVSEEDGDWWASVFQCGAVVTLAAALSVAATTSVASQVAAQPQDEPPAAGTIPAVYSSGAPPTIIFQGRNVLNYVVEEVILPHPPPNVDEDFWQNPVAPVPLTFIWPQPFSFDQNDMSAAGNTPAVYSSGAPPTIILQGANRVVLSFPDDTVPSPAVAFQPDEDLWQNPVPPVPLAFAPFQPWVDEQTTLLFGQPDEDFWVNPTPPISGSLIYPQQWTFDDQTPALTATVDEYFWQNPTPPVAGSLAYPQQWQFDEQAPLLYGQPDEDFWINPVAPVPLTFIYPEQRSFDEQTPLLYGQFDEDFWTPQIPLQLWSVPVQAITDDVIIVQQPSTFQPDEDFWSPQVPSQPWSIPPQAITDDEIVGQPSTQVIDELFFAPLLTCAYPNYLLQQWQFETGDNGGLVPPPVVIPKIQILRWSSVGSRITPPYNP